MEKLIDDQIFAIMRLIIDLFLVQLSREHQWFERLARITNSVSSAILPRASSRPGVDYL